MTKRPAEARSAISIRADSRLSATAVQRALRKSLDQYLEQSQSMVAIIDPQGRPIGMNPAFDRFFQAFRGASLIMDLVAPGDRALLAELIASARQSEHAIRGQIDFGSSDSIVRCNCLVVAAGRAGTLLLAEPAQPYPDLQAVNAELAAELGRIRSALEQKTIELQAVLTQADELAHTDSLTLLPNRRSILADLQRQVTYADRYEAPLAISMLDLDGFKAINDQSGHTAGDKVLVAVSRGLRDRIRQPDQIGRYGGDEFLVILPNSSATAASEQASRLCHYVRSTMLPPISGTPPRLTLSVGITQLSAGESWRALLDRADRALYEAKRQGGDRWLILEA